MSTKLNNQPRVLIKCNMLENGELSAEFLSSKVLKDHKLHRCMKMYAFMHTPECGLHKQFRVEETLENRKQSKLTNSIDI